MKLKFLSGVCISPGQDAEAGQIHEVPDESAKYFLNRGIAVEVADEQSLDQMSDEVQEQVQEEKPLKRSTKK